MNLDKFVKKKGFVHTCPFCNEALTVNMDQRFKAQDQIGYDCRKCYLPNTKTKSGVTYSKYTRAVMENVDFGNGNLYEQIIINDTFYITVNENEWYIVHNSIIKGQTTIVLGIPAKKEHFFEDEEIYGLVWIGEPVLIPFVDSWEPGDEVATLAKIKTYLLFL